MSFEQQRGIWHSRYRMCVAVDSMNTDPSRFGYAEFAAERSDRRWRAVAGLAATYIERDQMDDVGGGEHLEAYGLSDDALDWLQEADYAKMFAPKVKQP